MSNPVEKRKSDSYFERSYTANIRAVKKDEEEDGSTIEGLAVVTDQWTEIKDCFGKFKERIDKNALKETDMTDVRLLVNHDFNSVPLARSRNNNKSDKPNTMQLEIKDDGLHMKATLDKQNNSDANKVYSAISRGDMDGMSFCFFVSEENQRWYYNDDDELCRDILKIDKIIEVSCVTFPAYEGTSLDNRSQRALDSDRNALENARQMLDSIKNKDEKPAENVRKLNPIVLMYSK